MFVRLFVCLFVCFVVVVVVALEGRTCDGDQQHRSLKEKCTSVFILCRCLPDNTENDDDDDDNEGDDDDDDDDDDDGGDDDDDDDCRFAERPSIHGKSHICGAHWGSVVAR